jgi:hypothetical protein
MILVLIPVSYLIGIMNLGWVWFFKKQIIPVLVLALKNIELDSGPILGNLAVAI